MRDFKILRKLASGRLSEVAEVPAMLEVKRRLQLYQLTEPGEYYVLDLQSRQVVAAATETRPELHPFSCGLDSLSQQKT